MMSVKQDLQFRTSDIRLAKSCGSNKQYICEMACICLVLKWLTKLVPSLLLVLSLLSEVVVVQFGKKILDADVVVDSGDDGAPAPGLHQFPVNLY